VSRPADRASRRSGWGGRALLVLVLVAALGWLAPRCLRAPTPDHLAAALTALEAEAAIGGTSDRAWRRGLARVARGAADPCTLARSEWSAPLRGSGWDWQVRPDLGPYAPDAPWVPWEPAPAEPPAPTEEPNWRVLWRGCDTTCDEAVGEGVHVRADPGGARRIVLRSTPPEVAGTTRSSLVASTADRVGPMLLEASIRLDEQLRAEPNPWESGWLFWRLAEDRSKRALQADPDSLCGGRHGLYLALKTNGWELGKFGPGYSAGLPGAPGSGGCQRFLATGRSPRAEPGRTQRVCVLAVDDAVAAWIDGELLVGEGGAWSDRDDPEPAAAGRPQGERRYDAGAVGLYLEDASVSFTDVALFGRTVSD
jgi:hypothetical protein